MLAVVQFGTGTSAAIPGVSPVAGKTGTADCARPKCPARPRTESCPPPARPTNRPTDAWFAAYAPGQGHVQWGLLVHLGRRRRHRKRAARERVPRRATRRRSSGGANGATEEGSAAVGRGWYAERRTPRGGRRRSAPPGRRSAATWPRRTTRADRRRLPLLETQEAPRSPTLAPRRTRRPATRQVGRDPSGRWLGRRYGSCRGRLWKLATGS